MIANNDLSQEIFSLDTLTAIRVPSHLQYCLATVMQSSLN